jgi:excisionase family DNA binding protein
MARYVSMDAAAEELGVSERTVRRMISEGHLPGYRVGKRVIRIKREDLDSLIRRIPTAGDAA